MSINFIKVLATAKQTILNEIVNKRSAFIKDLLSKNSIIKQRAKVIEEIKALELKKKELEKKVTSIGTPMSWDDCRALLSLIGTNDSYATFGMSYTDLPREVADDIKANINKPVFTNVRSFDEICNRFDKMMSMATGSKEQRAILMQFYSIDWKALGIDVPADMDISHIAVKDGMIIADTRLLATPKKSK